MRPKIVILTLVVALGLVGLMVVLRGVLGGDRGGVTAPNVEAKNDPAASTSESHGDAKSINSPAMSEEARAAQARNEVDQINELVTRGADPSTTSILLSKLNHPEAEVRKAAVDALVQLNDTNAIPGLESAAASAQDPHEKVALLDALAYLKLPEITANVDGRTAPNTLDDAARTAALNKANLKPIPGRKHRRPAPQSAIPGNPDQTQPAAPPQAQ